MVPAASIFLVHFEDLTESDKSELNSFPTSLDRSRVLFSIKLAIGRTKPNQHQVSTSLLVPKPVLTAVVTMLL